ncbi:MAG TPA: hypothetical protein VEX86_17685, partial [Longimicrobium sp.]|nr:hypothetical protein [Longimicrobium sp.]
MASSTSPARSNILREQVLNECIVMTRFALASGRPVPPAVVNTLENARFAPADKPMDMVPIVKAHDQLARLVAPATPRALVVLGHEHDKNRRLAWAGSVGLVRRMMGVAVFCVLLFMTLSLFPQTSIGEVAVTVETSSGIPLLLNELFWLAAAGIGASFALLRQINEFIESRTYDPKYEPTY